MDILNKFRKGAKIRNAIGFILVGLIFTVLGVIFMTRPKVEFIPINAVIADIQEEYNDFEESTDYSVFVNYTVDGVDYKNVPYGGYSSSMKVGDTIEIEYDPADPTTIQTPGGGFIVYVILLVGIAAFVLGILSLVKSIKQKSSDLNEYDRVDMSKVSDEQIADIASSSEPMNSYVFHFDKNLKQGYEMEDSEHRLIYEARMTKFSAVKPFVYEFTNHYSHSVKTFEIGHTVSKNVGFGEGSLQQFNLSSSFKIDGVNNWDYLADKGFAFDVRLNGIKPCFDVKHYGVKVAYIETAGTEVFKEDSKNPIRQLPVNGIFRVECRSSDLDNVFMTCFSIARAIFYENN